MGPSLRSQMQSHAQNSSSSSTSSSSHPMMSSHSDSSSSSHPMMGSQSGGRRRSRSRSRRARRAGSSCMMKKGGMKMGRSKAAKGGMKKAKSRASRGGMAGPGLGAVIKEALVPFGLFAFQKRTQRKRHHKKNKSHRRR